MPQKLIAIPASLVPKFEEWGEVTARLFGELRRDAGLKPTQVPKDQAWYWTEQWQQWEREADEDIVAGRVKAFNSINDLIESLDA
jgi:hypothetical protein